ncbi:MAG TPA: hypothetical protein VGS61_04140 [Acidimicrobiales bacterium]|nr:hypothetical protein [Acidimicrobiales bacterium]
MAVLIVLVVAVAVVAAVVGLATKAGKRPRLEGRSIFREAGSHVNVDGSAKVAYATLEEAQRAAQARTSQGRGSMRAYACRDPRCGGFHIGHG